MSQTNNTTKVKTNRIEKQFKAYVNLFIDMDDSQLQDYFATNFPLFTKDNDRMDFKLSERFDEIDYSLDFHYHIDEYGSPVVLLTLQIEGEDLKTFTN